MHSASSTSRHGPPPTFNSKNQYTSTSSSTPLSPAPTTTSSAGYSAYGYGGAPSAVAGPSGTSGSTVGVAPSTAASSARTRMQGLTEEGERARRQPSSDLGRPGGSKESKETSRMHYMALRRFLQSWLQNESPTSRASAREKLTRLSRSQFNELSTDVYDELLRRQLAEDSAQESNPFLPVRQDFHPKRNQARQKLATLPKNRFKDLASDVFFELRRRYPEFEEQAIERESAQYYDNPPPAPGPVPAASSSRYNASSSTRQPLSVDDRIVPPSHARRPSETARIPKSHSHQSSLSVGASANSSMNEVVVPNKSTISEEVIEVPYAKHDEDEEEIVMRPTSSQSQRREAEVGNTRDSRQSSVRGQSRAENRDYSRDGGGNERDGYARTSVASTSLSASRQQPAASVKPTLSASNSASDLIREQRVRGDLEAKLTGMERRLQGLEKELEDSGRRERWERERTRELEEEVRGLKERAGGHATSLRSVQQEVEDAQAALDAERQRAEGRRREDQAEIVNWRQKCDALEEEVQSLRQEQQLRTEQENPETMRELQVEVVGLLEELKALSERNEELLAEKDSDLATIRQLDDEVREYKRRWETTKTELRNLKATSTMFISKPLTDDHIPASPDGNIADVHVTSFQTAIDNLLTAARSSTPTGVLPAMKGVVEAITNISDDVKAYEAQPNFQVDSTHLEDFKHRSTTTLNALMQAARNHAMSSGLSPVSLLDAAAGHVSSNVVEIIKLLKIRKTMKKEMSRSSLFAAMQVGNAQTNGTGMGRAGSMDKLMGGSLAAKRESSDSGTRQLLPRRDSDRQNGYVSPDGTSNGLGFGQPTPPPETPLDRAQSVRSAASLQSDAFDLETRQKNTTSLVSNMDNGRTAGYPFPAPSQSQPPYQPMPTRSSSRGLMIDTKERGPDGLSQQGRSPSGMLRRMNTSSTVASEEQMAPPSLPPRPAASSERETAQEQEVEQEQEADDDRVAEWEELKPYLQTQSSALVNAIQKLLAEIRNAQQSSSSLNDHLSEVIAIGSSIVAVSADSLPTGPPALKAEGERLLAELVKDTDRLGEHQGRKTFEKSVRQEIASAAFGVAKSLKALMKLGTE